MAQGTIYFENWQQAVSVENSGTGAYQNGVTVKLDWEYTEGSGEFLISDFSVKANYSIYQGTFYIKGAISINSVEVYRFNNTDQITINNNSYTSFGSLGSTDLDLITSEAAIIAVDLEPIDDYARFWFTTSGNVANTQDGQAAGYIGTAQRIDLEVGGGEDYPDEYLVQYFDNNELIDSELWNIPKIIIKDLPEQENSSTEEFYITGKANGGFFNDGSTTYILTAVKKTTTVKKLAHWEIEDTDFIVMPNQSYTFLESDQGLINLYAVYETFEEGASYSNNKISQLEEPNRDEEIIKQYSIFLEMNDKSGYNEEYIAHCTRFWNFEGWATSPSSSSANAAEKYTSNKTLYAYYTYTDENDFFELPEPVRSGYLFLGWGTSANQTSNLLESGTKIEITEDKTYYAIWEPKGLVHIYTGSEFEIAIPYIYDGSTWKQVIPYIYDDSIWKITTD